MRDTFDVSKLGFSTTPKTPMSGQGLPYLPYLKIPWLAAAQADSKQKWPLSLAARPAMWEGPETQSARLFGDFERSANQWDSFGRPRIFSDFLKQPHSPFFFEPILKGIEEEGC